MQQVYPKRSVSPACSVPAPNHTPVPSAAHGVCSRRACVNVSEYIHRYTHTKSKAPRHDARVLRRGDQNSSQYCSFIKMNETTAYNIVYKTLKTFCILIVEFIPGTLNPIIVFCMYRNIYNKLLGMIIEIICLQ